MLGEMLEEIHSQLRDTRDGEVATYIPALAKADPESFGLALATTSGEVITAGDADVPFSIQSVSKPFTFALAMAEHGPEDTFAHVGTEPSGDPFNSVELDPTTNLPYNPMVNAGAISMAGLMHRAHGDRAFEITREGFHQFAGVELGFDEETYLSEITTAHRNRAIAHLLRSHDTIEDPVEEVVDLYTRLCSLTVTARDLAVMAATAANVGTNPLTQATVVDPLSVRHTLSIMFTCGMYDYAGEWAVDVGLPAKSGVSGGVVAVVNRQLGIGLYSPPLDARGNSVRAIQACVALAEELGLHAFEFSNTGSAILGVYL